MLTKLHCTAVTNVSLLTLSKVPLPSLMPAARCSISHSFHRRGSSGFVQLAIDTRSGEHVAIKFIGRGDGFSSQAITRVSTAPCRLRFLCT